MLFLRAHGSTSPTYTKQKTQHPFGVAFFVLVPPVGVEPTRYHYHRILSSPPEGSKHVYISHPEGAKSRIEDEHDGGRSYPPRQAEHG